MNIPAALIQLSAQSAQTRLQRNNVGVAGKLQTGCARF
jgi:hypothetical protein